MWILGESHKKNHLQECDTEAMVVADESLYWEKESLQREIEAQGKPLLLLCLKSEDWL